MNRRLGLSLAVIILAAACASQDQSQGPMAGDPSEGPFRGRWWNYYDRGLWYQTQGDYEQAEADFRAALKGRSSDAWSARTYGLHFHEYFPNRELGVTLFYQGDLNGAETYLQDSLDDVDTARAQFFLDQITRERIARGLIQDGESPRLTTTVTGGALVAERDVGLSINAGDDVGVAQVRVNGNRLYQRGSRTAVAFEDMVRLEEGNHELTISAADLADKETTENVTVRVDTTSPAIAVIEPAPELITEANSVTLRGVATDRNGVAEVRLDDRLLASAEGGESRLDFTTELPVEAGENKYILSVFDAAGNENRAAVKVYGGDPNSARAKLWWLNERAPEKLQVASTRGPLHLVALLQTMTTALKEPIQIDIDFPEIPSDEVYTRNEIPVVGRVLSRSQVASLLIGDRDILDGPAPMEGEEQALYFDRRVPLTRGPNQILVAAQDNEGNEDSAEVQVEADFVLLDSPEAKMPVAMIHFWNLAESGYTPDPGLLAEAEQTLTNRFSMVDRQIIEEVLVEQGLTAEGLTDPMTALRVGQIGNAQLLIVGLVREYAADNVRELVIRAVDAETSQVKVYDVTVDDMGSAASVEEGFRGLLEQLKSQYPRLTGKVMFAEPPEVIVDYTAGEGVRVGLDVLVIGETRGAKVHPETGKVLVPAKQDILVRARLDQVADDASVAVIIEESGELPSETSDDLYTLLW